MGSIEPIANDLPDTLFNAHVNGEMYGALIKFKREEYQKLYVSEGGMIKPAAYDEVEVVCETMSGELKKALVFKTTNSRRSLRDIPPSKRYLDIIRNGARQLGCPKEYLDVLAKIPVTVPLPKISARLARPGLRLTFDLEYRYSLQYGNAQNKMSSFIYTYGSLVHSFRFYLQNQSQQLEKRNHNNSILKPVSIVFNFVAETTTLLTLLPQFIVLEMHCFSSPYYNIL
mmetsp:Transcript_2280/g.4002  ORF Transcript_2280/g.4002 Transcript_2280/m.4002 type:complete len:228 (-) Transcript_2280:2569-3252(-)